MTLFLLESMYSWRKLQSRLN